MKRIIIDIEDWQLDNCKKSLKEGWYDEWYIEPEVIANGIPLEKEFKQIKAEIHTEAYCERTFGPTIERPRVVRLNKIDEIIDNRISKLKENKE